MKIFRKICISNQDIAYDSIGKIFQFNQFRLQCIPLQRTGVQFQKNQMVTLTKSCNIPYVGQ